MQGTRLGHATLLDGLLVDGLWDAFHDVHMGDCAEMCAEKYGISRAEQVGCQCQIRQVTVAGNS